jgi:hypothetical protein
VSSEAILRETHAALVKLVTEYLETLDGISEEDLNSWKPSAEQQGGGPMNTFAALSVHVVEAAIWRVVHQIFGHDYPRERDREFSATATRKEIDDRFSTLLSRFAELIATQPEVDLYTLPPTIRETSPDWTRMRYLMDTISHTALHLGHAQIHRQLWLAEHASTP